MRKLSISFVALLIGACTPDPVETVEVQSRTSAIISNAVENTMSSFTALGELATLSSIGRALDSVDGAFATLPSLLPTVVAPSEDPAEPPPPRQYEDPCLQDPYADGCMIEEQPAPTPEEVSQGIIDFLNEYVFTDENLESSDGDAAVYLMRGEALCPSYTECIASACDPYYDPGCPEPVCTERPNDACIAQLDAIELRVRATLVGDDGLDIAILVGPAKVEPLVVELRQSSIAAEVDLADASAAIAHVASVTEGVVELPRVMEGRLRAELVVNGEQDVSVTASIVTAVLVEVDLEQGPLSVALEAAAPLFGARVQGLLGAVSVALSAGALDVSGPYAGVTPEGTGTGSIELHLDGASFAAELVEGATSLVIANLGVGGDSSYIAKDGAELVAFDLNADSGRVFSVGIEPDELGDSALFTFAPELAASLMFNLQAIAADFPGVEEHFLAETYGFDLSGSDGASVKPVPADGLGFPGGLEVVTGALTLYSSLASVAPVVAAAGECLVAAEPTDEGAHPFFGHFAVVACPE